MTTLRKVLPFTLLALVALWTSTRQAQAQNNPDCSFTFNFTGDDAMTGRSNLSGNTPCVNWRVTFSTTATLTTQVTFETSPDNNTWTAVPNTICSATVQPPCLFQGTNPTASGAQGMIYASLYGNYVRVTTTGSAGAGTGTVRAYGAKGATASGGAGVGGGSSGVAATSCPVAAATSVSCPVTIDTTGPLFADCWDATSGEQILVGSTGTHSTATTVLAVYAIDAIHVGVDFSAATMATCYISTGGQGPQGIQGATGPQGANATGAGAGVGYFLDDTNILPTGTNNANEVNSLTKTPITATPTQTDSLSPSANTVMGESYLFNTALNVTTIPGGIWTANIYGAVNNAAGTSTITFNQMVVTPFTTNITTSGSGTSRTATAASGTPFCVTCIVASATATVASFLQTPQGLYQITARTSDTVVTITTPGTYANEAPATSYAVWLKLFSATTLDLTTTNTLNVVAVAQPAYTIALTAKLGIITFATSTASRTVTFTHNGTSAYSNMQTPIAVNHNDLPGLQGGTTNEYYHLTNAQHTSVFIRTCTVITGDPGTASPVLADDNDSPVACGNTWGVDWTIQSVTCWADAGSPTVTPILTGGSGTSILTGALTCGTAGWAAGTVQGTAPVVHTFSGTGATCSSTPCTIDVNITTAGGVAKYIVVRITGTI